ncbi:MAG TPA: sodium-translocating pyrophosphatase, partial [Candidatus Nanoarchaeia archaeon]|nr:sodium-translocating pyrophosphatase [Candidatus Nanoarchaeia archaeon]
IPEDDPRNPAVIADNVGDNVGDCAGMAADLFESYTVTLLATMILAVSLGPQYRDLAIAFPLMVSGVAIIASIIGSLLVDVKNEKDIWPALNRGIWISAFLTSASTFLISYYIFDSINLFYAALVGIVVTLVIGWITEYYTSTEKKPVKDIAESAKTGPATTIISGLAIGMQSTLVPIIIIVAGIFAAYLVGGGGASGIYAISIAALSMLSMTGIIVAVDAYGPITDNAGGIAEMSKLPKKVRDITDPLDAVGNTTKAVTKGFAIGSAALAALSLFVAFGEEVGLTVVNIYDPRVVIGLFIGGLLPFLFGSMTMSAVGRAAFDMVNEVRRQFRTNKGIMKGTSKPDYARCVDISTRAAIRELMLPGIMAVAAPLLVGFIFGVEALAGLLAGSIVTGLLLGITMTTSGAAWDNAKKYVEKGNLGGKGSDAHKATVVGDTVGDPFKDTVGPSMNPLIKVLNTVSILFASLLVTYGGILGSKLMLG